jgi:hypothetical protein
MIKDGVYKSLYDWGQPETYTMICHKGHMRSINKESLGIILQHRGGDFLTFIRELTEIEKFMFELIEKLDPFDPSTI